MAKLRIRGDVAVVSSGSSFLVKSFTENSDKSLTFTYDCSRAEKKPQENTGANESEDKGSDNILAFAFSASGTYFALTDDSKRLILFHVKPSWECISVRFVVRRCTALVFTHSEDQVIVADKSGDVYSFSLLEPNKAGELLLGHLSMLLDVTLSPDDKYIVTSDRDEKIRITFFNAPHIIQSFCLGHTEFVNRIIVLSNYPTLLLSSSGDGTLRLWEYESGKEASCFNLGSYNEPESAGNKKHLALSAVAYCENGNYVAALCDCLPLVHLLQLDAECRTLVCKQKIFLEHRGWDIAFDKLSRLWILQEDKDTPVMLYRIMDGTWQNANKESRVNEMVDLVRDNWDMFQESVGTENCCSNLYKVTFDNMSTYLQKKEERTSQKQSKRKGHQPHDSKGAKMNKLE
ncbi:tRNA (guanine-N(7)-)-methyltransferase non-catalytic subunit WDR4 [Protopterus annectens]|uniref:tRNA (guanine-N(7)-)-methyltransferase non-catalytic subunit WDR4 n=1 Tax=Protopterus annectens TaxID=7888 RepID=UPI001CF9A52A|nr:tRNA (guanine-N(7)-)-methyltransferase non-catalytic subunit WDR4 [Protopterus annectens]